jgi:hypothetical protein
MNQQAAFCFRLMLRVLTPLAARARTTLRQLLAAASERVTSYPTIPVPARSIATGGRVQRLELPPLSSHWPMNPSIVQESRGSFAVAVRGLNGKVGVTRQSWIGGWRYFNQPDSQVYLAHIDEDMNLRSYDFVEDRHVRAHHAAAEGIEDVRLFFWKNELWGLGTAYNFEYDANTMLLFRLHGARVADAIFLPSPRGRLKEKNWIPLVANGELHFIYGHSPPEVYRYDAPSTLTQVRQAENVVLEGWSGSSCAVPWGDGYVAILHKRGYLAPNRIFYVHRLVAYDAGLEISYVGEPFHFEKVGIEFCAGLALTKDFALLSYGLDDAKAFIVKVSLLDFVKLAGLAPEPNGSGQP